MPSWVPTAAIAFLSVAVSFFGALIARWQLILSKEKRTLQELIARFCSVRRSKITWKNGTKKRFESTPQARFCVKPRPGPRSTNEIQKQHSMGKISLSPLIGLES